MEDNYNGLKLIALRQAMGELNYLDFFGLAQIAKVNIFTEDNKIRKDFENINKEIENFYCNLSKPERNKFLRRVRQIAKYNRIHNLEEFSKEET